MDSIGSFAPSVIAGIVAGVTSAPLLIWLFKGKVRHERELIDMRDGYEKRISEIKDAHAQAAEDWSTNLGRVEETLEKAQGELREQYRVNADQAKEMVLTINWLKGLAGLAESDRRRNRP